MMHEEQIVMFWVRLCPDPDVTFYLYSKKHQEEPEPVRIGADPGVSNLSSTAFNPALPTKIIIHGYNSDMYLNVLVEIKKRKLHTCTDACCPKSNNTFHKKDFY
jgi:hypothetical protein